MSSVADLVQQLADMKLKMAAKDLAIAHYHKKSKSRKFRIEELEADLEEAKEKIAEIDPGDSDATNVQYIEDKPKEAPEYYDDYYGPCIEAQAQVQVLKAENANLKYQYFVSGLTIQPWSGAVVEPTAETTFPNDEPLDGTAVTSEADLAVANDEPSDETIVAPEAGPAPTDDEPRGHKRTLSQSEVASTENIESKKARPAFWSGDLTRRPKKNPKRRQAQTQV